MKYLFYIVLIFISINSFADQLQINEVMCKNITSILDDDDDESDWIELYNSGDTPLNLKGYFLSDDPENPYKWQFGEYILPAHSYLIVWASGKDRQLETITPTDISNLKVWLSASDSETIILDENSNENKIVQWKNKVGTIEYAFQDDSLSRPQLINNAINGNPIIHFDGVNDYLNTNFVGPQDTNQRTIMAIVSNIELDEFNQRDENYIAQYGTFGTDRKYGIAFQSSKKGAFHW